MRKVNNKNLIPLVLGTLILLGILAVGFLAWPDQASADAPGYVTPYNATAFTRTPKQNNAYVFQDPQATPPYEPMPVYTAPTSVTRNEVENNYETNYREENTYENTVEDEGGRSLSSSVIFGGNSFYPSGLIQWVFFAILICLIVIIFRKITGAQDRYHSTPLKHA